MTDFAGNIFTMESFTGLSTDSNGEINLALQHSPVEDSAILINIGTQKRLVEFKSRSGSNIIVVIRKMQYDRTDTGGSGSVTNQPAGVTVTTASSYSTSTFSSTYANNDSGQPRPVQPHSHSVSTMFNHDHTFTATDLPLAVSESNITITVGYAF